MDMNDTKGNRIEGRRNGRLKSTSIYEMAIMLADDGGAGGGRGCGGLITSLTNSIVQCLP